MPLVQLWFQTTICLFLDYPVHCGFETGVAGLCAPLRPNVYFDDPQGDGRKWDVSASGAVEGSFHWKAFTENTGFTQIGTMSIIPTKVGGKITFQFNTLHSVSHPLCEMWKLKVNFFQLIFEAIRVHLELESMLISLFIYKPSICEWIFLWSKA